MPYGIVINGKEIELHFFKLLKKIIMKKIILMTLFLFFGCKITSDSNYSEKLKKCIMSTYRVKKNEPLKINYYEFMSKIEKMYIDNNILMKNNKNSYKKLYLKIDNLKIDSIYFKQKKIENKYSFVSTSYINIEKHFITCPLEATANSSNEIKNKIKKQIYLFNLLEANGFDNKELLLKYLNTYSEKDTKNIVYRSNLIYLTMLAINEIHRKKIQSP